MEWSGLEFDPQRAIPIDLDHERYRRLELEVEDPAEAGHDRAGDRQPPLSALAEAKCLI